MRQRAELARALGGDTDLLLMDEPFSSLDYLSRLRMRLELARVLQVQPRTVVLVTHDIEEAAQLADRVLVLSDRPARVRNEVRLSAARPRDPTQPDVVRCGASHPDGPGARSGRPRLDHVDPRGVVMIRSPFLRWAHRCARRGSRARACCATGRPALHVATLRSGTHRQSARC